MKRTFYPSIFILALILPLFSSGQSVFVKRYNQAITSADIEWDGNDFIVAGTYQESATERDFHLTKLDTSGKVLFHAAFNYARHDVIHFVRPLPGGQGYLFGGNSWGKVNSTGAPHADSSSIIFGKVDPQGNLISARRFLTADLKGGTLTGLQLMPDSGYVFSALMPSPAGNPRTVLVKVSKNDQVQWTRHYAYRSQSNLAPPVNNLALADSGLLLFVNMTVAGNPEVQIMLLKESGNTVSEKKRWVLDIDRALSMEMLKSQDSLALYAVMPNGTHGVLKLGVNTAGTGLSGWGAFNSLLSASININSKGTVHTKGKAIAFLSGNSFAYWLGKGHAPEGFNIPNSGHLEDFVVVNRQIYFTGTTAQGDKRFPVLVKSLVSDSVSNCFTQRQQSFGHIPFHATSRNGLAVSVPIPFPIHDTAVTISIRPNFDLKDTTTCIGIGDVWPGDANSDGSANNVDALFVGIAYDQIGPARATKDSAWLPYQALNWNNRFKNGADYKQADCNGDSVVNMEDLRPIKLNYSRKHFKTNAICGDNGPYPPIYLVPHTDSVAAGDTAHVRVMLGNPTLPIDSIYGLVFSLSYDANLVDTPHVHFAPVTSWLGTPQGPQQDLIHLKQEFIPEGMMDLAICRNDQVNVAGHGHIATFHIFTIDDIAGKQGFDYEDLHLEIRDVYAITLNETEVCLSPHLDTVVIFQSKPSTGLSPEIISSQIALYPNPTDGQFWLHTPPLPQQHLLMVDAVGRKVWETSLGAGDTHLLDISQLGAGMYILQGQAKGKRWVKRLVVR